MIVMIMIVMIVMQNRAGVAAARSSVIMRASCVVLNVD
jgi:hypothetical protein